MAGPGRVIPLGSTAGVCKSAEQGAEDGAKWVNRWANSARADRDARNAPAVRGRILDAVDVAFVRVRRFVIPRVVSM